MTDFSAVYSALDRAAEQDANERVALQATIDALRAERDKLAAQLPASNRGKTPGTYKPTSADVGATGALKTLNADFTTTSNGQVIENLHIKGRFIRRHSVTVRNCVIESGMLAFGSNAVKALDAVTPASKFFDCTIKAGVRNVNSSNGVHGRDVELHRCDISGFVDGVGAQDGNVTISACWIHDLPWYADDPGHSDGTHNDGVQVHGGRSNYLFVGNLIEMGRGTAGFMLNTSRGPVDKLTIDRNWITGDGCGAPINIGQGVFRNLTITGNIISKHGWKAPAILAKTVLDDPSNRISGTVFDDGIPVPVRRA